MHVVPCFEAGVIGVVGSVMSGAAAKAVAKTNVVRLSGQFTGHLNRPRG
jgi:hypothetical protein